MEKLSFGIGCFRFYTTISFGDFDIPVFVSQVQKVLESIPSLTNLQLPPADELDYFRFEEIQIADQKDTNVIVPYVGFFDMSFDILIPTRIQEEILRVPSGALRLTNELFHVSIIDTDELPVAVVYPDTLDEFIDGPHALMIVRKFLQSKISEGNDFPVGFGPLGPSPYHVDFFVEPMGDKDISESVLFTFERQKKKGYDEVRFYYNPWVVPSAEAAIGIILEKYKNELGLYYRIVQGRVFQLEAWVRIEDSFQKLVEIQKKKWHERLYSRLFKTSRLLNETYLAIAEFETEDSRRIHQIRSAVNHYYSVPGDTFIQQDIDEELAEWPTYPSGARRQVLDFLENRRITSAEMYVALIAAILGGIIGAMIALLLN